MNNNLKNFIEKNIDKAPKVMNIELQKFANENGLKLTVGNNYYWGNVPTEEQIQAVSINETFVKTIELLGGKIEPGLNELIELLSNDGENDDVEIKIETDDSVYVIVAFMGILSKTLDIWTDFNNIKVV